MPDLSRGFYDVMYRITRPNWDTGLKPPEVAALIQQRDPRGRALDLGGGTGTTFVYLAKHGYNVVAVNLMARVPGRSGLTRELAQGRLAPQFALTDVKQRASRHNRGAAWYRFVRQENE